ncbi:hypothetical protein HNV27_30205 [Myxococcus xanthus]|nr:hypothetical protein [Myxococcus xanthus]
MVSAILAGRKTVTRRVVPLGWRGKRAGIGFVGGRGEEDDPSCWGYADEYGDYYTLANDDPQRVIPSPFGQPGDRLWCKETWRTAAKLDGQSPTAIAKACTDLGYRSPWAPLQYEADGARVNWNEADWGQAGKTRVSIHMPRWASRLTLEMVSVRFERLHDITDEDAKAEGLTCLSKDGGRTWKYGIPDRDGWPGTDDTGWPWTDWDVSPRVAFRRLWSSIYGPESWERNDWVARGEFRAQPLAGGAL